MSLLQQRCPTFVKIEKAQFHVFFHIPLTSSVNIRVKSYKNLKFKSNAASDVEGIYPEIKIEILFNIGAKINKYTLITC